VNFVASALTVAQYFCVESSSFFFFTATKQSLRYKADHGLKAYVASSISRNQQKNYPARFKNPLTCTKPRFSIRRTFGAICVLTAHFRLFLLLSVAPSCSLWPIASYWRLIRIKTISKSVSIIIANPNGKSGLNSPSICLLICLWRYSWYG
jgi:hypothetical protein